MLREISHSLSGWSGDDTWIVIVGALAAMACALPGVYLVLRRQSMMGDALSHSVLLGLVTGFVAVHKIFAAEWISRSSYESIRQPAMFVGALVVGVLTAVLTEWVQKLGRVDSTAALGVVFTTLFALGLLLIRIEADSVHIDPDCVLYGTIETVVLDTVGNSDVPRAAIANGAVLAVGLLLMLLFYKELKISAFDPELATTLGINARVLHYTLMAATSITLVAAFESVGSILVIAMLIVPAATASLLTERLSVMILLSLVIATLSSLLGHAAAITLPEVVFGRLGFPEVRSASTAGMMSAAAGVFFVSAVLFAPKQGVLSRAVSQVRLSLKILGEDILGMLFRLEESQRLDSTPRRIADIAEVLGTSVLRTRLALLKLMRRGRIATDSLGYRLTEAGRNAAGELVRSHRLWEVYLAKHFNVPERGLHAGAERAEHYIDPAIQEKLARELESPQIDPHGKAIPSQQGFGAGI